MKKKYTQLKLFEVTQLKYVELIADSPKKAFYRMCIIYNNGKYYIKKESGAGLIIQDKKTWVYSKIKDAYDKYHNILKQKMKKNRKRTYKILKTG